MAEFLLLVEDDPVLGPSLEQRLVLEGFAVRHAISLAEAREILRQSPPSLVLSDIRLPDGSGETLIDDLSDRLGAIPTIFMTAYGDLEQAVRLLRHGARDYLVKPFDLDECVERLKALSERSASVSEAEPFDTFGLSDGTAQIRKTLEKVADVDLPVLILGETGTGKEVAARFLHAACSEKDARFLAVNCGQLSLELADSTLFGHEKGAFTGAHQRQLGVFETVGSGTLLLDEIGEIPPPIQVKILRLLQERMFQRLGSHKDIPFEGRVVCATNRDLEDAVADGHFREDLWYRINVVTVRIPPLRDRTDEIEPLLTRFLADAAGRFSRPMPELDEETLAAALAYDWPGNIRELRNRAERAVALSDAGKVGAADLFPEKGGSFDAAHGLGKADSLLTLADVRDAAECAHIQSVLDRESGNMRATAEALGISRTTLWEKLRRFGLSGEGR